LTVLFCDLVGSTQIAAQLDPEEWREIVADYHRAATQAIERFGGHVAQYLGDGVMAYFGWPEAHDNDAERAGRAGLAILDAISRLNEHPAHPKLSARIGIDSGTVVVGAGAGKDVDVFGDTPNIAARVQAAADGYRGHHRCSTSVGLRAVRGRRSRSAGAQGRGTAGSALPGSPAQRSARTARSSSGARADSVCRARRRIAHDSRTDLGKPCDDSVTTERGVRLTRSADEDAIVAKSSTTRIREA
jgi:hypothetical protein